MLKQIKSWWLGFYHSLSLKNLVWVSFSMTAAIATIIMGISFYSRFSIQLKDELQTGNQALINQVNNAVGTYVRDMMKLSDTLYFTVVKDVDITQKDFGSTFQLLYETNKEQIKNIALFNEDGEPIVLAPAASLKEDVVVKEQTWFKKALERSENLHFSSLHVQNLFYENQGEYEWVISLSRAVQITEGNEVGKGVLLIDMTYNGLKQIFNDILLGQRGYVYMLDQKGELLHHPKQQLIASSLYDENIEGTMNYGDGTFNEIFKGTKRQVSIKTVGYTGWKIAGVTYPDTVSLSSKKSNLFFVFLFLFFMMGIIGINSIISSKVSLPIKNLEKVVKQVEMGNLETSIRAEGFYEVRHLGQSVNAMSIQIKKLMKDIVREHEEKRKSELNVLQSQINPHFLYNTLDIIVWMIENEQKEDAAKIVTALARFFRISLSKGKTIIPIRNELEHVRNYLTIQQLRYKNKFQYNIKVTQEIEALATLKLIIQPLVENAIYHGMIYMDGDGLIEIEAYEAEGDICMSVADNGLGMDEEKINQLLKGDSVSSQKGSGIGVRNVNERIKLYFGEKYGLCIESEPDIGTKIIVRLPKIDHTQTQVGGKG